jgi:hypothetical protein
MVQNSNYNAEVTLDDKVIFSSLLTLENLK